MIKRTLSVSGAAMMAGIMSCPAQAAPWVKSYVVGSYGYAFRYGGRADYQRGSYVLPGVDCPRGSTTFFSDPASISNALSFVSWRTKEEIADLAKPPSADPKLAQAGNRGRTAAAAFRGYKPEIQTYVNPFAAADPGQPEVASRIGEGFDLDGKRKASDFISPDGELGIDNALYRAWGCSTPWRSDEATMVLRANDKMTQGMYTIVVRLSGSKDPMNDDRATLEIGYSPDKIVKDARGNIAAGYSFRILQSQMYSKLKATVKNGVVETEQAPEIHMPEMAWWPNQIRDADFRQGKIRLTVNPDGTANGLVGGYRNWRDLYAQETYSQDGAQQGIREREDHVALYFALRRNADGMFNAKTGRNDGISSVYRMKLTPAFVVSHDKPFTIPFDPIAQLQIQGFNDTRLAMIKATDTLIPQAPPPPNGAPGRAGEGRIRNPRLVGANLPARPGPQ
jgi:hypothetical protein